VLTAFFHLLFLTVVPINSSGKQEVQITNGSFEFDL